MGDQYDKAYIKELAHKWRVGTLTIEERQQLEDWDRSHADEILRLDNGSDPNEILNRMLSTVLDARAEQRLPVTKTNRLWPRIATAAAIAFIVVGAYFFRSSFTKTDNNGSSLAAPDIAPGKNGGTLTLANGHKILINEALAGDIASQSGVKISKTSDGEIIYEVTDQGIGKVEYNTLTTSRGEQTQIRLPDGSLVFLNAASSLRYPTSFTKAANRSVSLMGEGYFEIFKDKLHPFIVKTAQQEVRVLGTHFNINSYADELETKTTLFEGSVNVSNLNGRNSKILKPGQQAIVKGDDIKFGNADIDQAMSWKNGDFVFVGEDLTAVMRQVARWYNVDVEYLGTINSSGVVSTISRTKKLSQVLKALQINQGIHFKVEGRRVLVMP